MQKILSAHVSEVCKNTATRNQLCRRDLDLERRVKRNPGQQRTIVPPLRPFRGSITQLTPNFVLSSEVDVRVKLDQETVQLPLGN